MDMMGAAAVPRTWVPITTAGDHAGMLRSGQGARNADSVRLGPVIHPQRYTQRLSILLRTPVRRALRRDCIGPEKALSDDRAAAPC